MSLIKQPSEKQVFAIPFVNDLGSETIAEILGVIVNPRGLITEVAPLSVDQEDHDDQNVRLLLSGGTDGETYLVTARVRDGAGQEHEADGEIDIIDLSFTLPDAAPTPYLTAADYVKRFGKHETVRLTDERRLGRIDAGVLGAALADASAYAEAVLVSRYALPLTDVPPLLATIVADLARERLHGDKPTEAVAERANRARSDLRDIARGILRLPLPTGAPAEAAASTGGVQYAAGTTYFTDDALAGF